MKNEAAGDLLKRASHVNRRPRKPRRRMVSDACEVCEEPVYEGEDRSTYCGTVHEDCFSEHASECAVCDEDNTYHGDED